MTAADRRIKDAGWFYHAPSRRKSAEPVLAPPTSQIPGLNYEIEGENFEDSIRPLFRDTDTKYIRLAKRGGRQNLLQFNENPVMSEKPMVGYPRSEWFYLEDNAIEDAEQEQPQSKYEFRIPEYMAHDVHQPSSEDSYALGRPPFANDRLSAHDREGKHLKDKTLKLPEVKRPGYGVRSGKPLRIKSQPPERTKPSQVAKISQIERERPHLKYLPLPQEEKGKPKMSKLLSFAYNSEWHDNLCEWQEKQDKNREKYQALVAAETLDREPINTEYRTTIGKQIGSSYRRAEREKKQLEASGASARSNENKTAAAAAAPTTCKIPTSKREKELFKLSKFKNIPSKIDSHNKKEVAVNPIATTTGAPEITAN